MGSNEWMNFRQLVDNNLIIVDHYGNKIEKVREYKVNYDSISVKILVQNSHGNYYCGIDDICEFSCDIKGARLLYKDCLDA